MRKEVDSDVSGTLDQGESQMETPLVRLPSLQRERWFSGSPKSPFFSPKVPERHIRPVKQQKPGDL